MKAIRWAMAIMFLAGTGCSDDGGVTGDLGIKQEARATEAGTKPDTGTSPDGAIKPDGATKPDGAKPSDGPKPDAVKPSDGPKPDAVKPSDGPKPDAVKPKPDGPQAASFCDVVYRITGVFKTTDAPIIGQFTKTVGTNAATPPFNPARTTPFTPAAFAAGFVRLRFPNVGGAPAAGAVKVVELYLPMEFAANSLGTNVVTDVDQSAGMLALAGTPPQIGDPPTLTRSCAPVASGTLAGTTLTWGACSAIPDNTTTWTSAKAVSNDPGCLNRMSTWGHVGCTSGFCNLVTGLGNQRKTWDQKLNAFTFSSANYATATFTMAEVQTPNETNVKTFIALTATSVLKVECDTAGPLTCDEN